MSAHPLLAACGLYCGACYHYRASLPAGTPGAARLLAESARRHRPAAGYTCRGCRSEARYVHSGCAVCAIRACADARGLAHCGECPAMPCGRLLAFQADGRLHHRDVPANLAARRAAGPDRWLADQQARWSCACGAGFSWYEQVCQACGAPLASCGPDPTIRPAAVFFDLDGTLIDYAADVDECWLEACRTFAAALPGLDPASLKAEIDRTRTWYWSDAERHRRGRLDLELARADIVAMSLRRFGIDDPALASGIARAFAARREPGMAPLPGAVGTLAGLRAAGIRLALLTNGSGAAQRHKIERFALAPFFDCIAIEGEVGAGKPDERVYRYALDTLGVAACDTWMVGDNLVWDVQGPQQAGILGIWLDRPGHGLPAGSPVRPDRIVRSPADVLPA